MDIGVERELRESAMAFLAAQQSAGTLSFTREDRFTYDGQAIRFMNPQTGIWRPAGWQAALSISTVYVPPTQARPYDDVEFGPEGLGRYKWRGTDADHPDNRALRAAMTLQLPLIWFLGSAPGRYAAVYPVHLVAEEPAAHQFIVAVERTVDLQYGDEDIAVRHAMRETKQRLHQAPFRAAVLEAYTCRCAICRFGHAPLLDAAHIIGDAEGGGASVKNGLALCKMHHGAYDTGIMGITPNYVVEVNRGVLEESDGPMLLHGIQEFHGRTLMVLPGKRSLLPDREALQQRYEQFLAAS